MPRKPYLKNIKEEEIIKALLLLQEKLGRSPSKEDWCELTKYSSRHLINFGGLNKLKQKANISIIAQHYSNEESMEKLNIILKEKNGTLICKDDIINTRSEIIIECNKCKYVWITTIHSLNRSWCPYCAGTLKGTLEKVQKIAESKGGKCLSDKYVDCYTLMEFLCSEKHYFTAKPCSISGDGGTWCPICAVGLYERICKGHFEQLFSKSFPKIKPYWLINDRGNLMELDGYCEELNLAFEHNGAQHDRLHKKFMSTQELLNQRKEDDLLKQKLCKENNTTLIIIPELETNINICDLKYYIKEQCILQNYPLPENYDSIEINFKDLYHSKDYMYLQEIKQIAKSKGGKLLSDYYLGNRTKLEFICKKGHIFWKDPMGIKRNQWCPICFKEDRGLKIRNNQKQQMIELYDKGLSLSQVSKILNIPATTISYYLNKNDKIRELSEAIILSKKPKLNNKEIELLKQLRKTETLGKLSDIFKISIKTIKKYLEY